VFNKKTLSQLCVCGLLQADHEGSSAMFLMGMHASLSERESDVTDVPADQDRAAAFLSPKRNRPVNAAGMGHVERPEGLASPRQMGWRGSSGNLFAGGSVGNLQSADGDGAEQRRASRFPRAGSVPPASPPKDAGVFDYYSLQADPSQSNALRDPPPPSPPITSYPIPVVPDREQISEIEKRIQNDLGTGIADGQLLPEEAELLRKEVDVQRRMLQDHDSKLREQHGELVELTEQKRCLEVQMESTIQHVVKVMSEDKKRLNQRIGALEHEKAQIVHSNQQMQGLINTMGRDLQGKMHEIGNLHARINREGEVGKKAIKVVQNFPISDTSSLRASV
jgi:hypothetical protein